MLIPSLHSMFPRTLASFRFSRAGSVLPIFALTLVPILGVAGAAVDYGRASSANSAIQIALDSAALSLVKTAPSMSPDQIQARAQNAFQSSFNRTDVGNVKLVSTFDSKANSLTLSASSSVKPFFMALLGVSKMSLAASSTATLNHPKLPICVMVTDPDSNHTLLVKNNSGIDFTSCMVQVNTKNWDAVEARDTSYIHSTNGENCFVGDIHYGDVTPPKAQTCTMFPDPFASFSMPSSASHCTYTGYKVTRATTLSPGTYCGGLTISAVTTFSPGLYVIKDGDLAISGTGVDITAKGVTFLLIGKGAGITISSTGKFVMTPADAGAAGQLAGFVFYLDQNTPGYLSQSSIQAANITMSGIIYLKGQQLLISNKASVTVNPGSIVAGFILPDNGKLALTGSVGSATSADIALLKASSGSVPVLSR